MLGMKAACVKPACKKFCKGRQGDVGHLEVLKMVETARIQVFNPQLIYKLQKAKCIFAIAYHHLGIFAQMIQGDLFLQIRPKHSTVC